MQFNGRHLNSDYLIDLSRFHLHIQLNAPAGEMDAVTLWVGACTQVHLLL